MCDKNGNRFNWNLFLNNDYISKFLGIQCIVINKINILVLLTYLLFLTIALLIISVSLLRLIYPIRFYVVIIYYFQILFLQKAESVLTVELLQHLFGGEMEMDIIYAMPVVFITKWMVKIGLWSNQREGWYVVYTLDIYFFVKSQHS